MVIELLLSVLIIGQFWYINRRLKEAEKKINLDYKRWKEEFTAMEDTLAAMLEELEKVMEGIQAHGIEIPKADLNLKEKNKPAAPPDFTIKEDKKKKISLYLKKGLSADEIARSMGIGIGEVQLYLNIAQKEDGHGR